MLKGKIELEGFSAYHLDSGKKIELDMQDLRLEGAVTEIGARLNIRHIFRSAEKTKVEVVYAFMLPRDATLKRFRVVGDGFSVSSSLMKTSEAKEKYDEGINMGSLSVLAQQYRDGVINLSVGNLRPNETVAVYLEVFAGVDIRDDGFRFRFPFTLAPGYHSKARYDSDGKIGEITLPEDEFGDVIYPPWWKDASNLHTVSFQLEVTPIEKIKGVSSPSHPLNIDFSGNKLHVSLSTETDVPNRDLILDATFTSIEPRTYCSSNPMEPDRFVCVLPSKCFNIVENPPRKIVFVVDRSGSMRGIPMTQAKRALRACLGALSAEDTFGIVAFDDRVELFKESLVEGETGYREEASGFIQSINARGGTELLLGIISAFDLLESQGDIMVLTDGQLLATEDIMNQVIHERIRIHCLGIGSASQDRFLTLLSRKTGGITSFISTKERVDLAALKLFTSITSPVAENVKVIITGKKGKINPPPSATVYPGVPLTIYGTSRVESVLSVNWKNSKKELLIPLDRDQKLPFELLKLIQGARIITDIDSQLMTGNWKDKPRIKRLERKLLETSMEYSLSSRAASLVAVVKRKDDVTGDHPITKVVPVGFPEDVDFRSYMRTRTASSSIFRPLNVLAEGVSPLSPVPDVTVIKDTHPSLENQDLDESDILFELVALMNPDGGMPGKNEEERVLYSLLMLLHLSMQPPEVADAFKLHYDKLLQYIETNKTQLTPVKSERVTRALNKIKQGKPIRGSWIKTLNNLIKKTPLPPMVDIWRQIE